MFCPLSLSGPAGIRTPEPRLSSETSEGLHDSGLCVIILARLRAHGRSILLRPCSLIHPPKRILGDTAMRFDSRAGFRQLFFLRESGCSHPLQLFQFTVLVQVSLPTRRTVKIISVPIIGRNGYTPMHELVKWCVCSERWVTNSRYQVQANDYRAAQSS